MKAKYDVDPLVRIYNILNEEIKSYLDFVHNPKYGLKYKIIDDIIKLILQSNDCKFSSYVLAREFKISDDYYLYLVSGAIGNDTNPYYDYIEICGSKYLVVFLDYFKDMKPKPKYNDGSIESIANSFMGNYNYAEAIKTIVEIYIDTCKEYCKLPTSTCAEFRYYTAPIYISAKILNNLVGFQEEDTGNSMLSYDQIMKSINSISIEALILGIYKTDFSKGDE